MTKQKKTKGKSLSKKKQKKVKKVSVIKYIKNLNKGEKSFYKRLLIFLVTSLLLTYFYIDIKEVLQHVQIEFNDSYLQYVFYFILVCIIFLKKEKLSKLKAYKNSVFFTLLFLILAILAVYIPPSFLTHYLNFPIAQSYITTLALAQIFLFLAIFDFNFIRKKFAEESLLILLISLIFIGFAFTIQYFWGYFFWPLETTLNWLLPMFDPAAEMTAEANGFSVIFKKFHVNVGPPCSGIYSIIAFSILFFTALYFANQKNNLDLKKGLLAYSIALIILYILNIVRIIIIIMVGAYISQKLAIDLFHEYLSAIFLMTLFVIYLNKIFPKLIKK